MVPVDKGTALEAYGVPDVPTPPITRPPSVEHIDDRAADVVIDMVLENDIQGQGEHQPIEGNMFAQNLTTAIMLVVQFLVGPRHMRARRECRTDDDESRTPRSSPWEKAKATARKIFDKVKDTIRDIGERFKGFFDDPIARTARLLDLGNAFKVRDMPRKKGQHKRHDSDELFERDQKRLGADEFVTGSVKLICSQVANKFPEVGYNQVSEREAAGTKHFVRRYSSLWGADTPRGPSVARVGTPVSSFFKFILQSSSASGFTWEEGLELLRR